MPRVSFELEEGCVDHPWSNDLGVTYTYVSRTWVSIDDLVRPPRIFFIRSEDVEWDPA